MTWDVEFTDEFGEWWDGLGEAEQAAIESSVRLLIDLAQLDGKERAMARKFAELQAKMSLQARARSDALYEQVVAEMPLHELRQARELSQVKLAQALNVNQAAVSKMEHRTDMYISTLRDYIRAMGGDLEIVARFPDGEVKISNFADQDDAQQPA